MGELIIRNHGFEAKYEPVCRLYRRDKTGLLRDLEQEFSLPKLGGVIPQPGDCIVDPFAPAGRDRSAPINRTVYEVVRRYFKPTYPKFPLEKSVDATAWVVLEVIDRQGDVSERDLLVGGDG